VTLSLLAASSAGFEIVPTTDVHRLIATLGEVGRGAILHLHWTSKICQAAATEAEATQQLDEFRRAVRDFKARGGHLVWTVHNTQPHELDWPDLEQALTTFLAGAANRIHVMNPATSEAMRPVATLPKGRIRQVAHPSYVGIYPISRGRDEVRASLGFSSEDRVVALIGELRAYKGVGLLLEAMTRAASAADHSLALLLAGKTPAEDVDELRRSLPIDIPVVFHPEYIDSGELADWFQAADLCVFPYERILNSGSTHLAATMSVPVVLPGESHLIEMFAGEPWVHFYDLDRPVESLSELLTKTSTFEPHRERSQEFCRERSPWRVSLEMLRQLYLPVDAGQRRAKG
jgi:beta-1,4-mannosyltransferase